jgi:hypothetical protein
LTHECRAAIVAVMPTRSRTPAHLLVPVFASLALALGGCSVPHTVIPAAPASDSKPGPVPIESGFLSDYGQLRPTEQFADLKIFRDVSRKNGYRRILFRPVEIWRQADKRLEDVSEEDLQYLADALYKAMQTRLDKSFEMISKPEPGALEINLAFTLVTRPDAKTIDFFSTEVPVRDLSRREGPLVAGTRQFVRDCALEVEFNEIVSAEKPKKGERRPKKVRAAVFDTRRGADTAKGTVNTWEDVHSVFERWAGLLDERLESLRDGTYKPKLTVKEKNPPVAESQRQ